METASSNTTTTGSVVPIQDTENNNIPGTKEVYSTQKGESLLYSNVGQITWETWTWFMLYSLYYQTMLQFENKYTVTSLQEKGS